MQKDKQYKRSLAIYIVSIYKVKRGWLFISAKVFGDTSKWINESSHAFFLS